MKLILYAATIVSVAAPTLPAFAVPATPTVFAQGYGASSAEPATYVPYAHRRHHPRYGGHVGQDGGFRVNRYGYGNYVAGPAGGFAGYPPGSPGAQIYRQQEEWKCENVPESC